jgi:hypothetical protein
MHEATSRRVVPSSAGAVFLLLAAVALPASTIGGEPRDVPSGLVGAAGGLAFHSGRTVVVDATSGASTRNDEDVFLEPAFAGGPLVDLGFAPAGRRLQGTFGLRLQFDASAPGPFFAAASLLRYRRELTVDRGALTAVAPWGGIGVALQWAGRPDGSPFLSFPLSLGCDLELIAPGLFVGLQLDVSMMNPLGPAWSEHDGSGSRQYESHYNGGAAKLAVTYRFY